SDRRPVPVTDLCAIVLAAGEGRRLRPLTADVPKALCPVGNVPLLELALTRLARLGFTGPERVAVNACYLAEQVVAAVGDRGYLFAGFSLLPWSRVAGLEPVPTDLVRTVWRPAEAAGELTVVEYGGTYLDTGTPRDYLAANLHALGERDLLVAPDATLTGDAE